MEDEQPELSRNDIHLGKQQWQFLQHFFAKLSDTSHFYFLLIGNEKNTLYKSSNI